MADHVIGHKPKDSYEKQTSLYAENLRNEYAKGSKKINMFSNLSTNMKSDDNVQLLKEEIDNQKRINQTKDEQIQEIQRNVSKIMSFINT